MAGESARPRRIGLIDRMWRVGSPAPDRWRQARRRLAMAAAGIVSRLQDQIASRLGELFRIAAAVSDKLKFVVGFGKSLLAAPCNKLKFASLRKRLLSGACDKLNVAGFCKRLFAEASDELKFVGPFLAALPANFQSHVVLRRRHASRRAKARRTIAGESTDHSRAGANLCGAVRAWRGSSPYSAARWSSPSS